MRGRRVVGVLLSVLGLLVITLGPVLAEPVGPHDVTFVTQRYDYPVAGQSTWYYTVTDGAGLSGEGGLGDGLGSHDEGIKYVVLELGGCCEVAEAGEWVDLDTLIPWSAGIWVAYDNDTGIFGIRFWRPFHAGETRNYYFTVEGNYALEPDKITAAIRTTEEYGSGTASLGEIALLQADPPYSYEGFVDGPNLACEETTAITLSSFSATSPSAPAAPSLLLPGVMLAGLVPVCFAVVRRHGWR